MGGTLGPVLLLASVGGVDDANSARGMSVVFGGQYAYRLFSGLDVGVAVDYWSKANYQAVLPAIAVRLYAASEGFEIGLGFRGGVLVTSLAGVPEEWLGTGFVLEPHIRLLAGRKFAFHIGLSVSWGNGRRTKDVPAGPAYNSFPYNIGNDASLTAFGLTFGGMFGL